MKLTQLSKKPELVKLTLDDADIVEKYGEPLEFWIYDRTNMDIFVRMATLKPEDFGQMVDIVNQLILDEDGTPVVKEGYLLPTDILTRVITKVVDTVGK